MAAPAPAPAPALAAPAFSYRTVPPGGSADDAFDLRGLHNLYVDEEHRLALGAVVVPLDFTMDGPRGHCVPWPNVAEITLPFATLAADVVDVGYGACYIKEAAWERTQAAVMQLVSAPGRLVGTHGILYEDVEKVMATAPESVRDALVLRLDDFEQAQADVGVPEDG